MNDDKLELMSHPLLKHYLTKLRDAETSQESFRRIMGETSRLAAYEALRDLGTVNVNVKTPLTEYAGAEEVGDRIAVISIMRAGNGMLDSIVELLPFAQVGHIGIYRDKFIRSTVEYFIRLPKNIEKYQCLVLDPLLATGDTAIAAVSRLKSYGAENIRFVALLVAPQGLEKFHRIHPDVKVYALSLEQGLDENGYILPGLGDAGDRLYGTSK